MEEAFALLFCELKVLSERIRQLEKRENDKELEALRYAIIVKFRNVFEYFAMCSEIKDELLDLYDNQMLIETFDIDDILEKE